MDIQFLMRQAKKIEKAVEQAKAQLGDLEVEAEAGGGLVQVKMNGRLEVKRITIDPKALDPAGKEMLEDLLAAAATPEVAAPVASIASVERAEREARAAKVRDEARTHPNIQEAAKLLGADIEGTDEL
jgi:DNA-binding YbaB/EbfC family protein